MPSYKKPGVCIKEISISPASIAEVETAVPAFIGYTEKATSNANNDLILKPTLISSMTEYEALFGDCAYDEIALDIATSGIGFVLRAFTPPSASYILWYAMRMFFDNGGGKCYVVSVGTYQQTPAIDNEGEGSSDATRAHGLLDGLNAIQNEGEPTLLLVPEATKLEASQYQRLVQAMLLQCHKLRDRFCIFDIYQSFA